MAIAFSFRGWSQVKWLTQPLLWEVTLLKSVLNLWHVTLWCKCIIMWTRVEQKGMMVSLFYSYLPLWCHRILHIRMVHRITFSVCFQLVAEDLGFISWSRHTHKAELPVPLFDLPALFFFLACWCFVIIGQPWPSLYSYITCLARLCSPQR